MNFLRDHKVVEGLQELIEKCAGKEYQQPEQGALHKVYKQKKITGREMRLIVQIRDYEMDQVILDLGLDANFFPKQT